MSFWQIQRFPKNKQITENNTMLLISNNNYRSVRCQKTTKLIETLICLIGMSVFKAGRRS